jgi:hypothetical protein
VLFRSKAFKFGPVAKVSDALGVVESLSLLSSPSYGLFTGTTEHPADAPLASVGPKVEVRQRVLTDEIRFCFLGEPDMVRPFHADRTVAEMKRDVIVGGPVDGLEFVYMGKLLRDEMTVSDIGFDGERMIVVHVPAKRNDIQPVAKEETLMIDFVGSDRRTYTIKASARMTVEKAKKRLARETGKKVEAMEIYGDAKNSENGDARVLRDDEELARFAVPRLPFPLVFI